MSIQYSHIHVYNVLFLHFHILRTYGGVLKSNTGIVYIIHIGIEINTKDHQFVLYTLSWCSFARSVCYSQQEVTGSGLGQI